MTSGGGTRLGCRRVRPARTGGLDRGACPPERDGTLTAERIAAACREDTALVSVMLVNNETGARHPLETLVPEIRRISPRALIHTDAVQAAGADPPLRRADGG